VPGAIPPGGKRQVLEDGHSLRCIAEVKNIGAIFSFLNVFIMLN
jgi:hypothetical protein